LGIRANLHYWAFAHKHGFEKIFTLKSSQILDVMFYEAQGQVTCYSNQTFFRIKDSLLVVNAFYWFFIGVLICGIFLLLLITAESLGFTSYPQAYLSIEASGNNLLIGANFASAASGYFDATADLYVNTLTRLKF
jgi:hypothetical protein